MNRFIKLFIITSFVLVTGCQETAAPKQSSSNTSPFGTTGWNNGGGTTGGTTGGSTDGGSTTGGSTTDGGSTGGSTTGGSTGGTGSTCYGSIADGDNSGNLRIFNFTARLAGQVDWVPTPASTGGAMVQINQSNNLKFTSNFRLKFRVKVLPQPNTSESCFYRNSGTQSIPEYTKLKYELSLHTLNQYGDINPDPFHTFYDQYVNVNTCSPVYEMAQPGMPLGEHTFTNPATTGPIYAAIKTVRSDYECTINGLDCPAEKIIRSASCWKMVLQVVNDETDDFN